MGTEDGPVSCEVIKVVHDNCHKKVENEETTDNEETDEVKSDDINTTFKLTDLNGNYINILMPGQWEVENNNYLIVGGIYRKNGNELEAQQFEKVEFEDKDEKDIDKEFEKRDEW